MTAVAAAVVERTHRKAKRPRGRGRPRKATQNHHHHPGRVPPPPPPPHFPVSRRSSRRPRQQLREDFYNVEGIVVDDEDDEYFGREQESEEEVVEEEVVVEEDEEEEEEDFRSKKKLKLLLKLHPSPQNTKAKARRRSGSDSFSSDEDGSGRGRGHDNDEAIDEIPHHEDGSRRLDSNCKSSTSGTGTPLPDSKTLVLILNKIQKKDKYGVFAEPVDPEELPDYHEVIEHPMDFGTIKKKLARNLYSNLEQFESDILLVCSNAMQYNAPETIYFKQASSMQELARKKFQTVRARSNSHEVILNDEQGRRPKSANMLTKDQSRSLSDKCIEHQPKLLAEKPIEDQPNSLADKPIEGQPKSLADKLIEDQSKSFADKSIENQANYVADKPIEYQVISVADKPIEKSMCSSPTTQAASGNSHNTNFTSNGNADSKMKNAEYIGAEKPENCCASVASSSVHRQGLSEKAEEPLEKSIPSSHGQKPSTLDEDRRATYTKSNKQPPLPPNSLFATFESEKKLVAVGLHDESSYARSLARFSATLGPIAWRIASKNIEKALPAGLKFGPGWVGEYEPPLTPIFSCENNFQQVSSYSKNPCCRTESKNEKNNCDDLKAKEGRIHQNRHAGTASNVHTTEVYHRTSSALEEGTFSKNTTEGKQALFGFPLGHQPLIRNDIFQQQRDKIADYSAKIYTNNKDKTDVPSYARTVNNRVDVAIPTHAGYSEVGASRALDMGFRNTSNIKSNSFKKSENSMLEVEKSSREAGELPDMQDGKNSSDRKLNGSLGFVSSSQAGTLSKSIPLAAINQKIDDPVKLISMLPGNVPNYPNSCLSSTTKQFISPVLSPRNDTGAALTSTAHTWMPVRTSAEQELARTLVSSEVQIKAPSTKPTWMFPHSPSGFQEVDNRRPVTQLFSKPNQMVVKDHGFHNKSTVASPQIFSPELSRFHGQSPWQVFVQHSQQRQRQNMLPPDLNIGFQPPGSPVQQSSSILVDSQQPDLALQL